MTRFKICGLRDPANALVAARAGADFLGLNFVPGVRRQITPEQARDIIDRVRQEPAGPTPRFVGLFADQPLEDVNEIVRYCGLDMAQLCGDETPRYWRKLAVPVIKQIKIRDDAGTGRAVAEAAEQIELVITDGQTALLDKYLEGALGGTGRSFDRRTARELAGRFDVVLAGGLTPENVGDAIAEVRPWGVDVSSGVETDGVKDPAKIVSFAREVGLAGGGTDEPA